MGRQIAVDTTVLIYLLEEHPQHFLAVKRLFRRIQKGDLQCIFSIIGMVELLTGVKRKQRDDLVHAYQVLLGQFPHFEIYSITEKTVDIASDLRVRYRLKTPDAVHLATAIEHRAEVFYTNDRRLAIVKEIKIQQI